MILFFLGRRFFSSLKFKMAGIDWWSFLFYYFFPSNFFIPFFDIYAHAFLLLPVSKEQNIFSLKISQNFLLCFSLLAMIFHSSCKYRLNSKKINNNFDCGKIYLFRCGFLKCSGRNFPREWKFIEIIEINLIESKWIRILKARVKRRNAFVLCCNCVKMS